MDKVILVGVAFQVDGEIDNAKEALLDILRKDLPTTEHITPLKVWASDESENAARCAELNFQNFKAQTDPEFGWTVQGKALQEAALQEAAEEMAVQTAAAQATENADMN